MNLQQLLKAKMAAGLDYAMALEASVSQLQEDARQRGIELTAEQLAEIGTARAALAPTSDPVSAGYARVARLVADCRIGPVLRAEFEKLIKGKLAAGLDRITAIKAAIGQVENDVGVPGVVAASEEDLRQLQTLLGAIETGRSPSGASAPRDAVTTLYL